MGTTSSLDQLSFQLFFGISAMVLLTIFIIVFFVIYQRRLLKAQLQAQQTEVAYQKELLNAGILAQEEERERMAIDLHDSIGGLLSTAKIYISNVNLELEHHQFELFKNRALEALNENIQEVRTITNDLLPQSLERLGIVPAARVLTQKLSELEAIKVHFQVNHENRLDKDHEKALYRIFQELINNTLKYAEAKNVWVEFNFNTDQLSLFYKDDGKGFDKSIQETKNKSYGLKSMESRVAFLNGQMTFDTAPGKGVEISIRIPLVKQLEKRS